MTSIQSGYARHREGKEMYINLQVILTLNNANLLQYKYVVIIMTKMYFYLITSIIIDVYCIISCV